MNIKIIREWVESANWLVRQSTEGNNKQVAAALSEIKGRTVSAHYVWQQGCEDRNYNNYLQSFFQWMAALFDGNYPGFELILTNAELYISDLRRSKLKKLSDGDFNTPPFPSRREALRLLYQIKSKLNQFEGCFEGVK